MKSVSRPILGLVVFILSGVSVFAGPIRPDNGTGNLWHGWTLPWKLTDGSSLASHSVDVNFVKALQKNKPGDIFTDQWIAALTVNGNRAIGEAGLPVDSNPEFAALLNHQAGANYHVKLVWPGPIVVLAEPATLALLGASLLGLLGLGKSRLS